jgi:hypothetical protein
MELREKEEHLGRDPGRSVQGVTAVLACNPATRQLELLES